MSVNRLLSGNVSPPVCSLAYRGPQAAREVPLTSLGLAVCTYDPDRPAHFSGSCQDGRASQVPVQSLESQPHIQQIWASFWSARISLPTSLNSNSPTLCPPGWPHFFSSANSFGATSELWEDELPSIHPGSSPKHSCPLGTVGGEGGGRAL